MLFAVAKEFGLAEILDSLVIRPGMIFGASMVLGHKGAIVGSLLADVLFYLVLIGLRRMKFRLAK